MSQSRSGNPEIHGAPAPGLPACEPYGVGHRRERTSHGGVDRDRLKGRFDDSQPAQPVLPDRFVLGHEDAVVELREGDDRDGCFVWK